MQVGAQVQAKLAYKGLGCAIDVAARVRPAACGGTDINDMTTVTFNHARQHGAGHVHQAFVVGVDHVLPVFHAGFVGRLHAQRQASVIDQHVDFTPFGRQVGNHLFNGGAVAYVQLCGQDAVAQLVFQLLETLLTTTRCNHLMSVGDEATRDAFTKTCCRPGN